MSSRSHALLVFSMVALAANGCIAASTESETDPSIDAGEEAEDTERSESALTVQDTCQGGFVKKVGSNVGSVRCTSGGNPERAYRARMACRFYGGYFYTTVYGPLVKASTLATSTAWCPDFYSRWGDVYIEMGW